MGRELHHDRASPSTYGERRPVPACSTRGVRSPGREGRIAERGPHLCAVEEVLVGVTPLSNCLVALALIAYMGEVDLCQRRDSRVRRLQNGDGAIVGVDQHRSSTDPRQRLILTLVLQQEPCSAGLAAVENGGDELVA